MPPKVGAFLLDVPVYQLCGVSGMLGCAALPSCNFLEKIWVVEGSAYCGGGYLDEWYIVFFYKCHPNGKIALDAACSL